MKKLILPFFILFTFKAFSQDVKKTPIRIYQLKNEQLTPLLDSLNNSFIKCRFRTEHPEIYFRMDLNTKNDTIDLDLSSKHELDSFFDRLISPPNGIVFYKSLRIHLEEYKKGLMNDFFCPTDGFTPWEISDKNYPFPLKKDYGYDSLDFFVRIVNSEVIIYKVIKCDD